MTLDSRQEKMDWSEVPGADDSFYGEGDDYKVVPSYEEGDDWKIYKWEMSQHPLPSPAQLAMIASSLSRGKNPKAHFKDAIELYYRSVAVLDHEIHMNNKSRDEYYIQSGEQDRIICITEGTVLFEGSKDRDEARQYLEDHGYPYPIKKAKTFRKHLNKLLTRFGLEDQKEVKRFHWLNSDMNENSCNVPKKWLDGLIKETKARRSAGTRQAHQTRRQNQASKTDK